MMTSGAGTSGSSPFYSSLRAAVGDDGRCWFETKSCAKFFLSFPIQTSRRMAVGARHVRGFSSPLLGLPRTMNDEVAQTPTEARHVMPTVRVHAKKVLLFIFILRSGNKCSSNLLIDMWFFTYRNFRITLSTPSRRLFGQDEFCRRTFFHFYVFWSWLWSVGWSVWFA